MHRGPAAAIVATVVLVASAVGVAGCATPGQGALSQSRDREAMQLTDSTANPDQITAATPTTRTDVTSTTDTTGADAAESVDTGSADLAKGKQLFSSACSGCHTLKDANATGNVGPNLDDLKPSAEVVRNQIESGGGGMPAKLLDGQDADDAAAYVASVAGM